MPFVLILAFAVSLGIHAVVMFGPDFELPGEVDAPPPLIAELKPLPRSPLPAQAAAEPRQPPKTKARRKARPLASAVLAIPDASTPAMPQVGPPAPEAAAAAQPTPEPAPTPEPEPAPAPVEARLPPHGMIRYRVDRGDSNFEIGVARHEWSIADGRYSLRSVVETTGLVWLFKALRIEMESRGLMTSGGLQPQTFTIRRNGQPARERADFDWATMTVRVGDRAAQPVDDGAQDLLSFNYQLGYLPQLDAGGTLYIATGKKYSTYPLEVLGDETIELPAGTLRTLHLRAPGTNTTELWLAYDYLLLPVKIRHTDAKGGSFVEVATEILVGDRSASDDLESR